MADGRAAGVALLIAGVIALVTNRRAPAEPPSEGPPQDIPLPMERFAPAVFGEPEFEITLVD